MEGTHYSPLPNAQPRELPCWRIDTQTVGIWDCHWLHHLSCQHLGTRSSKQVSQRISCLVLAEKIWQVFFPWVQTTNSSRLQHHSRGNKQAFHGIRFITKKHCYNKNFHQTLINLFSVLILKKPQISNQQVHNFRRKNLYLSYVYWVLDAALQIIHNQKKYFSSLSPPFKPSCF